MDIILELEINKKRYVYYKDCNNYKFGLYITDYIIEEIKEEELPFLYSVLDKFLVSNDKSNHVKLDIENYNGKQFQMYYDKHSGFIFPIELINGIETSVISEEVDYLFKKYNSQVLYSGYGSNDKRSNKKFLHKKLITIGLTATILLNNTGCLINHTEREYSRYSTLQESNFKTSKCTLEEIINSLDSNRNITDEDKKLILEMYSKWLTESASEYFDCSQILDTLSDITIQYFSEENLHFEGEYTYFNNTITVYNSDISDENYKKQVLSHELMHAFSLNKEKIGKFFEEALSEIMGLEVLNDIPTSYPFERKITYSLSEIIGFEPFLKFKGSGDISYIIDSLTELTHNEEEAINFMWKCSKYTTNFSYAENYSEIDKEKLENDIFEYVLKLYELKYGEVRDDHVMTRLLTEDLQSLTIEYPNFINKTSAIYEFKRFDVLDNIITDLNYYDTLNDKRSFTFSTGVCETLILMKLIGNEPFIKYNETGDISYIKNAINDITGDGNVMITFMGLVEYCNTCTDAISYETVINQMFNTILNVAKCKYDNPFDDPLITAVTTSFYGLDRVCPNLEINGYGINNAYLLREYISKFIIYPNLEENTPFEFDTQLFISSLDTIINSSVQDNMQDADFQKLLDLYNDAKAGDINLPNILEKLYKLLEKEKLSKYSNVIMSDNYDELNGLISYFEPNDYNFGRANFSQFILDDDGNIVGVEAKAYLYDGNIVPLTTSLNIEGEKIK